MTAARRFARAAPNLRAARGTAACLLLLLWAACAHVPGGAAPAPPVVEIGRDTTWSGEVRVDGIVHVRKSATLTILPGTRVLFGAARFAPATGDEHEGFAGTGMKVEGRVVARGTEDAPVVFTSIGGRPAPGSWDRIYFSFSSGNVFERCVFEGARYAFHAHFSEISVFRSVFRENDEGVRLGGSRVRIADSVFTRNAIRGINFRECRNEIVRNLVYANGDGIFLHSKDSASVIHENAVYANRGHNLRLGDLHAEDIDVSGNWWGTGNEAAALRTVYDGRAMPGIGRALLSPVLSRPPVAGAEIRGVFVSHMVPVEGGEVFAYLSLESGFRDEDRVATARTDANGFYRLEVPPGRYYVVGRADSAAGTLFAFPGRNPVAVELGSREEVGLPAVVAPPRVAGTAAPGARPAISVLVTASGRPVEGASVHAFREGAPDLRGAGAASALTDAAGRATLYLPAGRYLLAAKKRASGGPVGTVEEGGLFGVYPHAPVDAAPGIALSVEIPLFEKRGYLGDGGGPAGAPAGGLAPLEGVATLDGRPAESHVVYFYRAPDTVGRPAARSSVVAKDGRFTVSLAEPGEYLAYLRRVLPGAPGSAAEERIGPVRVRIEGGIPGPLDLSFKAGGGHGNR